MTIIDLINSRIAVRFPLKVKWIVQIAYLSPQDKYTQIYDAAIELIPANP